MAGGALRLPPLDYEDVFVRNQRPKVDEYDDYLFVVLHFPAYDKSVGRLNAAELDVFVGPDYVVTLPNQPIQPLEYLFERCRSREDIRDGLFGKGARLPALQDRRRLRSTPRSRCCARWATSSSASRRTSSRATRPRRSCATSPTPSRRSSTSARSCGRSARRCRTSRRTRRYIPEDLEIYFDDINDASERVWDMLENFKEVVEALESTNEAVISHRLNDTSACSPRSASSCCR